VAKRPGRLNLLILHGDGGRILRLNLPRWVLYGGLSVVAFLFSTLGAIFGDYLSLKKQWGEVAALQVEVAGQRDLIEAFHRRVTDIQREIGSWREIHAKIWEPLGPEVRGARPASGVGGRTEPVPQGPLGQAAVGQELERLSASISEEGQSLRSLERFMARAGKMLAALPSRWPVRGAVNSEFGQRQSPWSGSPEFHSGIDVGSERGTPVKAPAPGFVIFTGTTPDYGNTVIIDHGHDIKTLYGHLHKALVTQGQKVERGQQVALTGNTGKSSGPHLHYEILVRGQPVNPRSYLWD
jgi:murein DD-endopeptidase MepM/ murein hydrolase activator NlpD